MRPLLLVAMVFLLAGCHRSHLSCRSEYLYPEYLASCQINTPDPARNHFLGQQIIVSWKLPKNDKALTLRLHVRYGNREIATFTSPINRQKGWWIYRLINEDYCSKGGIISFQAELLDGEEVIDQWSHFLWARIIEIGMS